MGILQATCFTRVCNSRTPAGKDQEPLTALGEGSNNLQLRAQSPPLLQAVYRVRKHGRVTRNPQQLDDQVPLECNSQVMHLNLTQSHSRCATKQRDEWRGCSLAQRMSQGLKNMQEFPQTPSHMKSLTLRGTQVSVTARNWIAPDVQCAIR
jgi:hypothetical protein